MAVSKVFTTVTPFSKLVALILFIPLPFIGFYLGIEYQKSITPQYPSLQYDPSLLSRPTPKISPPLGNSSNGIMPSEDIRIQPMPAEDMPYREPSGKPQTVPPAPPKAEILCTMDAKQCPDGTWVGRTGPNCEFVCK